MRFERRSAAHLENIRRAALISVLKEHIATCCDEPVTQAHVRKAYTYAGPHPDLSRSYPMLDVILISLGLGFFVLSIGYTIFSCDRL